MNHTKLITKLSKFEKQKTYFNHTFRYLYDVLSLNNPKFNDYIDVIYPKELEIKDTIQMLQNGLIILTIWSLMRMVNLSHDSYDKCDDFDFLIVNFPYLSSNIPEYPAYVFFFCFTVNALRSGWLKI